MCLRYRESVGLYLNTDGTDDYSYILVPYNRYEGTQIFDTDEYIHTNVVRRHVCMA